MASRQAVESLEVSSNTNRNQFSSNLGSVTKPSVAEKAALTSSSPAILEPSKDKFRYQENGTPARKYLTHSCPYPVTERTPLISNIVSSGREESCHSNDEEQMNEPQCIDSCVDSLVRFRNSKWIHVFQIMLYPLPLSAVFMGITYAEKCTYHLPVVSTITGVYGVFFLCVWIAITFCQRHRIPCPLNKKFIVGFMSLVLVFLVVIDMSLLGHASPSFFKRDKHYCSPTFYDYSILKELLTALAFVLAAVFYLPGSRHFFCCSSCCATYPTVANVQYRAIQTAE